MVRYVKLDEVGSTNSYLLSVAQELPGGTVVSTPCQTAGRGQKGNRWLAEPGMNATFSYLFKPTGIIAREQFCISEAAALAVAQVISELSGERITVKWPNDIYHGDRKICGMLIENSLDGRIVAHSVIGIGININQRVFDPYAPNPTSLALITGIEHDVDQVMHLVCERLELHLATLADRGTQALHADYLSALYRRDGQPHTFATPDGTTFAATIVDVAPDGMLALRHADDGGVRHYAFKEVEALLSPP
ncbi:MAG: biotin--[Muribaculaceae bacterium]|nr:biotin--[acetyl-CoA-carboxylase] ligase [Muribaculaceae bacterium]